MKNPFYKPKTKQIEIDTIVHIPSDTDDEVEVDIHVQPERNPRPGPSGIRPTPSRPNVPPERRPTLQPRYSRPRPIEPANPGPSVRRPLRPRPNVPNLNLPNPTELQEMVEQMDQRAFENGIRLQSTPTLHPPQHITIGKHNI